jgi:hypothetical protein
MRQELLTQLKSIKITSKQSVIKTYDPMFIDLFPKTYQCLNSVSAYELLKYFPNHRDYSKLSCYSEINIIIDGFDYPIHDENPRKILSLVTYVAPEFSTGTLMYDKDKTYVSEVEWRQNRTLVFAGLTGVTWHSYKVEQKKPRLTVNTFLVNDMD